MNYHYLKSRHSQQLLKQLWRSVGQTHSLYKKVWQQTPDHLLFSNLSVESRTWRQFGFPSKKNMVVEFFSAIDKTLKFSKNLGLRWWWMFIIAVVRSHQKPMHGCNLDSSFHSNFFIGKDFKVKKIWKWRKNMPHSYSPIFFCHWIGREGGKKWKLIVHLFSDHLKKNNVTLTLQLTSLWWLIYFGERFQLLRFLNWLWWCGKNISQMSQLKPTKFLKRFGFMTNNPPPKKKSWDGFSNHYVYAI